MNRAQGREALRTEYEELFQLCDSLSESEWESQSLCREWRARDVVAHITALDRDTTPPRIVGVLLARRDSQDLYESGVEGWRGRTTAELRAGLRKYGVRMIRFLNFLGTIAWNLRVSTPYGRITASELVAGRVYDLWMHHRDVTVPLGRPGPDPARLGLPVRWLIAMLGPRLGSDMADAAGTIGLEISGPGGGSWTWNIGDTKAREANPSTADAILCMEAETFVLSSSGRDPSPAAALEAGEIILKGDEELGRVFLDKFTLLNPL